MSILHISGPVIHILSFLAFSFVTTYIFIKFKQKRFIRTLWVFSFAVPFITEVIQYLVPYHIFSLDGLLYNYIGQAIGLGVASILGGLNVVKIFKNIKIAI